MDELQAVFIVKLYYCQNPCRQSVSKQLDLPWAFQVECVPDPIADYPGINSSGRIVMSKIRIADGHLLVIASERSDENGCVGPRDIGQGQAPRLQTLIADFQYSSLLWIHPHGFNWGDIEEGWIKILRGPIQEIATGNIETSWAL